MTTVLTDSADPTATDASAELTDSPLARLTAEQIEQLAREFDAIHEQVFGALGAEPTLTVAKTRSSALSRRSGRQ